MSELDEGDAQDGEAIIRARMAADDLQSAATEAVKLYGPEILRFLRVRLRARELADEAFSDFCEDLWLGLPGFAWRSSLRTWCFVLARHAASKQSRLFQRVRQRETHDDGAAFAAACEHVRTETAEYLHTATKHRVRALRQKLEDDQQTLLVLRVERGLPWRELAIVMGEAADDASAADLKRAEARVRTRYQAAKKRLRELAIEAGLMTNR